MKRVAFLSALVLAGCGGGGGGGDRVVDPPNEVNFAGLYDAVTRRADGTEVATSYARVSDQYDVEIVVGGGGASVPERIVGDIDDTGAFLGTAEMPSGSERPMTGEVVSTGTDRARLTVNFSDGSGTYRIDAVRRSWSEYNFAIVDWDGGGYSASATVGPTGTLFSEIGGGELRGTFSRGGDFNGRFIREGVETRITAPFSKLINKRFQVASTGWPDDPEKPFLIEMVVQ